MVRLLLIFLFSLPVFAADNTKKKFSARLLAGTHQFGFDDANTLIESRGIEPINHDIFGGIELDQDIWGPLAVGFRYQAHFSTGNEIADPPADPLNKAYASFNRHLFGIVGRLRVVRTEALVVEIFGAAGGAQSKLKVHTSTGSQSFERTQDNLGGFTMSGATIGVGWGGFYLFGEVGMEWSKVGSLSRTTGASATPTKFETNGTFGTVGFMFSGIPSFIKMKK